jgi:hypothetical protein
VLPRSVLPFSQDVRDEQATGTKRLTSRLGYSLMTMHFGIGILARPRAYSRFWSTMIAATELWRCQKYSLPCPRVCRPTHARALAVAICALAFMALNRASAQQPSEDATLACGRALTQAERDWQIPSGLLTAIGTVESGRRAFTGMFPVIWPWTITAEGRGFYLPSKAAAVGLARTLQLRGVRVIDVGCFQVDLFYHPNAFANLEEAFDPDANARAAARILSLGRLNSTGWDAAIAAYHSASPLIGAVYLQRVHTFWPWTRGHPSWGQTDALAAYAVLLSPQARLVRVVTPADPVSAQFMGLPRVISADLLGRPDRTEAAMVWLHQPVAGLPSDLSPTDARRVPLAAMSARRGGTQP